jgi:hypothetical protein
VSDEESYSARFSAYDFYLLTELLKNQRFSEMKEKYFVAGGFPTSNITTHIIEDGKRRRVVTYDRPIPIDVWSIQIAIRGVVSNVKWIKDEKTPAGAAAAQPK